MRAEVVIGIDGPVTGPILRLDAPLSFWGGVDPSTGRLSDPRSTFHGVSVAGTVLMVPQPRGSSSSSAVVLELIHARRAPIALVLGTLDAIAGLGVLVAREMGLPVFPLLRLGPADQGMWPQGTVVRIDPDGTLTRDDDPGRVRPLSVR